MRFTLLIVWLCVSNAFLMIPGILVLESGKWMWGILLAVSLPALRMVRRYHSPRGYYLLGYNDGAGGDFNYSASWLSRRSHPQWFDLIMFLEAVIIVLTILSIIARRPP
jgi:hypothetical protein